MKLNETVRIHNPGEDYHGQMGTIIGLEIGASFPYQVRMDDGDFWFTAEELRPTTKTPGQTAYDFDKGFGIGGLGRHIETPMIPTVAQIAASERQPQEGQYVYPSGTTQGTAMVNGRCEICGAKAHWNPNEGQALCSRHWDG